MTKKVPNDSIEGGIREAFRHLGIAKTLEAIAFYTGQQKSESLLRKYSDPDDPKHHLTLRDAIAIDAAFINHGLPAPFQRISAHMLEAWSSGDQYSVTDDDICQLTLSLEAAAGLVAAAVLNCDGPGCSSKRRPADHGEILQRLQQLDAACGALRKAIAEVVRGSENVRMNSSSQVTTPDREGAGVTASRLRG